MNLMGMTAVELGKAIKDGQVSAVEATQACLDSIEACEKAMPGKPQVIGDFRAAQRQSSVFGKCVNIIAVTDSKHKNSLLYKLFKACKLNRNRKNLNRLCKNVGRGERRSYSDVAVRRVFAVGVSCADLCKDYARLFAKHADS